MLTKFLSEEEKQEGQKRVYSFQALNGMAFNFMGETPVYLMAIHFGASSFQLSYIPSVIFLTGFILVFLPRLLAGKNLIKVQSIAWFLRGMVVLLYLSLYFLKGSTAVILILVVYTLFCTARMVGVVIWNPLIRMVTSSQNRGHVLAQGNIANQSASVISKLISFIITSIQSFSGITGLLLLQVFGAILNSTAVIELRKIPCRETVEYHKSRNLFIIFFESLKHTDRRFPLLMRWISVSLMVLNSLTTVFLVKEAGFTANYVFLYTMVIAFSFILAGIFGKKFADRIGSRPLLIGMNIFSSIFFIIWMLLPVSMGKALPIFLFFVIGFLSNFFLLSNNVLIDRLVVNSMPESDSFSYNAMINFITAFFSFTCAILGGLLIDKGQSTILSLPNSFSYLFFFALLLSIIMVLLSLRIIDKGSLSAKETAAILFSLEGLRAFTYIGKLNSLEDPLKKRILINSISQNDAFIATEEMRSIIASPLSQIKGEVIKSLFSHPRRALLDDLLREAADFGSYYQIEAIFALGAYNGDKVQKLLLELLESSEPSVRSNAAKSLSRVGNTSSLEIVKIQAIQAGTPIDKMNYLIALKNMDETGSIFKDTFNIPRSIEKGFFKQTYYSLVSDLLDFKPQLSGVYSTKNLKRGEGLKDFLDKTRDLNCFNENHKNLISWFKNGNWAKIWEFCNNSLLENLNKDFESLNGFNSLINGLQEESEYRKGLLNENESTVYDDALAAVYFTYQVLMKEVH